MGSSTEDDLKPFGANGRFSYVAAAKITVKVMGLLVPAIIGAWVAVSTAVQDTKVRTQASKDLSEAGYQATKHAVEELQQRVQVLETAAKRRDDVEAAVTKRASLRSPRRAPIAVVPPMTVVVGKTKALPSNLDTASQAIAKAPPGKPAQVPLPPDAN